MTSLPYGCVETTVGNVTTSVSRGKSPKYIEKSALPVVNQRCIRWTGIVEEHLKFVDPASWSQWGEDRFLQVGDILDGEEVLPGFRCPVADLFA